MLRTALRNVLAHKMRLITTGLAVMLGIAFMTGTLVLTDTLGRTFDNLFNEVYANTDSVVRGKAAFDDPQGFGGLRPRIDASLVDKVAAVPGVKIAEGGVGGYAQMVGKDGEPIGSANWPHFGSGWMHSKDLNGWDLVAGHAPRGARDVVIDKKTADDAGFEIGDHAQVLVIGPPLTVRIVGIATFGGADAPGGASFVNFTTASAQKFVGQPGKFDDIWVVGQPGLSQQEITNRIQRSLPRGVEAITGEAITAETQDSFHKGFSFINTFLMIFAVVALLVGAFMIFNSFFITVAQRTRENAVMRAIGASRRQVLWSVILEALVIGLIASLVGLGVGVLIATGLKALLAAFGVSLPAGGVAFKARTVVIALCAGVIVTLVAAVSPARKAGKVPPVEAMRDVQVGSTGYGSKERVMVGLGLLSLGVAALLYGLFAKPSQAMLVVGGGMLVVFFAVSVLGRTISLPLSRVIGLPLPRTRGIAGHLARENAMRNPKRTAATASALMIGVGLVGFITILASSTKASVAHMVDKTFTGDVVVSPASPMQGGLDPALAAKIGRLPEVDTATGIRMSMAKIDGSVSTFDGVDPKTAFALFDPELQAGSPAGLHANGISVAKDDAEKKHLQVGDHITVVFQDTGPKVMTVAMIHGENHPLGDYIVGLRTYEANVAEQYDAQVFVKSAKGVSLDETKRAVDTVAGKFPGAKVLDQDQYAADTTKFVDQILGLVYALLALAIVIALLGIGNTLALSILERTRELGVMRAVGMTRAQLRSAIRWESVIIALQGTLLGLVIGIFFGWALVRALFDQGLEVFSLPVMTLLVVVLFAALAGVAAAVLPARRAARLNVLQAVVSE
jgi:putative ABC transport system permease protein